MYEVYRVCITTWHTKVEFAACRQERYVIVIYIYPHVACMYVRSNRVVWDVDDLPGGLASIYTFYDVYQGVYTNLSI